MKHFRDDELVTIQGRTFPVIGGRLRLIHEENEKVSIWTELVSFEMDQQAVIRATVETTKGIFTGTGVATVGRDPRLVDALLELAETRAVARALRHAGYGVETCGLEEPAGETAKLNTGTGEKQLRVLAGGRPAVARQQGVSTGGQTGSEPKELGRQPGNGNGGNGNRGLPVATAAQFRAIRTLARQVGTSPEGPARRSTVTVGSRASRCGRRAA